MATQSPEFTKAAEDSRKLKAKPAVDELLQVRLCAISSGSWIELASSIILARIMLHGSQPLKI